MRKRILTTLAMLAMLAVSMMTLTPTHAASPPRPQPDAPPIYCLDVTIDHLNATGTNTFNVSGHIKNDCGVTVHTPTGELSATEQCGGVSPSANPLLYYFNDWSPGYSQPWASGGTGYCEVCRNGKPVAWPQFFVTVNMLASGDSGSPLYQEYLGSASASVGLANSPAYRFPCP